MSQVNDSSEGNHVVVINRTDSYGMFNLKSCASQWHRTCIYVLYENKTNELVLRINFEWFSIAKNRSLDREGEEYINFKKHVFRAIPN